MNNSSENWITGWLDALRRMKDELVVANQKVNDPQARLVFDELFDKLTTLEKSAFYNAPTVIISKDKP